MPVIIGTSGWHYEHWRPRFYPAATGPARWLGIYAERFAVVEANSTFYRLPEESTFEHWRDSVPHDFVFALKASRYLTHVRRLQEPAEPVARLMERARVLGSHLGPVLLQLPPNMEADPNRLDATLAAFGGGVRVAVEPRHASWFVDEVRAVLTERAAALCVAHGGPIDMPAWRTTDWAYLRFHGGKGRPRSCYKRKELATLAARLLGEGHSSEDVYCFFNNDWCGCALRDARVFAGLAETLGREVTRVPAASDTRVR